MTTPETDLDTRRMELRGVVRLAGEVIPQYWPARTFVHHNPLHGLEHLPFDEAVRRGARLMGGRGYLTTAQFRAYLHTGRIQRRDLAEALRPLARDESVTLGSCRIGHAETLLACLTHALAEPADPPLGDEALARALATRLAPALPAPTRDERAARIVREDSAALGRQTTLSDWCERALGIPVIAPVNAELTRWCEAYLDEGHAAWAMPGRESGLYLAWKALAVHRRSPCDIPDAPRKIAALPEHPEDAVLESLDRLGIPAGRWQDYLALELTDLPGWAGYIKWRAEQRDHPWQLAYPASLVKFLAIRLWYTREVVQQACRARLGIDGTFDAILAYMRDHADAYARARTDAVPDHHARAAARLVALAGALDLEPAMLLEGSAEDLAAVARWIEDFPPEDHGPVWLHAFEAGYHEHLFGVLRRHAGGAPDAAVRAQSQSVFCIDVRSEPLMRNLEATGNHQTFSFPGFFAVAIRYCAAGHDHWTEQFPAVMRARNEVREVPRSYLGGELARQQSRAALLHAGHTLMHELKENVVTPYVMVETLGWFYGLPLIGKTLMPRLFQRVIAWLSRTLVPPVPTSITVDKLPPEEVEEMLAAEQRAAIWRTLRESWNDGITAELVEGLRRHALSGEARPTPALAQLAAPLALSEDGLAALVDGLRRETRVNLRSASLARERITRTGFTLDEQVVTMETVLKMLGLTRGFARLVLFCAHGSTSENNPYESALNCGACGGNEGQANARVLARMANNPAVRARLEAKGITIPADTVFVAGQLDTTTDRVELHDLEEVPPTHRKDVARLHEDLADAGQHTSQERMLRLPDVQVVLPPARAWSHAEVRSADWSQVRPEWGLAGNASLLIGPRALTKGLNLSGRAFMHSYDHAEDPNGRLLEVILTGPQLVCHWIAMEHYFSTVDNEAYGAGSKAYHNVVGRVGVMSGPWSDLRLGLARQSVWGGDEPYHEPMRLLTVIHAPRARVERLIARHELLQHYYHNRWVHLAAIDPEDAHLYRYRPAGGWVRVPDAGKESQEP